MRISDSCWLWATGGRRSVAEGENPSKHSVGVLGPIGKCLDHVPMFDDLPVRCQTKDVDGRIVVIPWPTLKAVQNHIVSFRYGSLYLHPFSWPLFCHAPKIIDEAGLAGGHKRIMLNVVHAQVAFDSLPRAALIEHQLVECDHIHFVLL